MPTQQGLLCPNAKLGSARTTEAGQHFRRGVNESWLRHSSFLILKGTGGVKKGDVPSQEGREQSLLTPEGAARRSEEKLLPLQEEV